VADSCIVCGGVLAVLLAARGVSIDGTRHTAAPRPGGPGGETATRTGEGPAGEPSLREDPPGPRSAAIDGTRSVPDRPATPGDGSL
jgi:signal peptidase II